MSKIKLYHYTTEWGAEGIRREGLIRSSNQHTNLRHKRYGEGVYFSSYSPYDMEPHKLALNCFTNRGMVAKPGIYCKTRYVVEIEFDADEVEKINVSNRDVYIYRGSIHLNDYQGRYRIYRNPVHPENSSETAVYFGEYDFLD